MCYDTALTKMKSQVQGFFHADLAEPAEFKPYFHQSGFTYPTMHIIKMGEPSLISKAKWGFVPEWGRGDVAGFRKKYNTLNIRSENLFSGISKDSVHTNRCLIIADGFFEPHSHGGQSVPYFCYIPTTSFEDGRDLFAFAGIYSDLDKETNTSTFSLLTMEANPFFRQVHNVKKRQPLVLDKGLYAEWFNPDLKEKDIAELMKNGFTSKPFNAHPVSPNLYRRDLDTNMAETLHEYQLPGLLF